MITNGHIGWFKVVVVPLNKLNSDSNNNATDEQRRSTFLCFFLPSLTVGKKMTKKVERQVESALFNFHPFTRRLRLWPYRLACWSKGFFNVGVGKSFEGKNKVWKFGFKTDLRYSNIPFFLSLQSFSYSFCLTYRCGIWKQDALSCLTGCWL